MPEEIEWKKDETPAERKRRQGTHSIAQKIRLKLHNSDGYADNSESLNDKVDRLKKGQAAANPGQCECTDWQTCFETTKIVFKGAWRVVKVTCTRIGNSWNCSGRIYNTAKFEVSGRQWLECRTSNPKDCFVASGAMEDRTYDVATQYDYEDLSKKTVGGAFSYGEALQEFLDRSGKDDEKVGEEKTHRGDVEVDEKTWGKNGWGLHEIQCNSVSP